MNKFLKIPLTILLVMTCIVLALYLLSVAILACIKYFVKMELESIKKSINEAKIGPSGQVEVKCELTWLSRKCFSLIINHINKENPDRKIIFEDNNGMRIIKIPIVNDQNIQNTIGGVSNVIGEFFGNLGQQFASNLVPMGNNGKNIRMIKNEMTYKIDKILKVIEPLNPFVIPVQFVFDICSGTNPIKKYDAILTSNEL